MRRFAPLTLLFACGDDISFTENPVCDGEIQPGEDAVDDAFDADGDGFYDGNNPGCADTYEADRLDCDDTSELAHPGLDEDCDDDLDNDCDGEIDEDCGGPSGFDGTWILTPSISYACAFNSVTLSVTSLTVTDAAPTILVQGSGGTQPGSMSGTFTSGTAFSATNAISSGGAGCDETYTVAGTFTDDTTMSGTLTATFTDATGTGFGCADCASRSWTFTAVR
jgi:hypothetical protein